MGGQLKRVLVAEGAAKSWAEVPPEISRVAERIGYLVGLELVIGVYKPAAAQRVAVDNRNTNPVSVAKFRAFSTVCELLAGDESRSLVIRALLLHNAASASSVVNGVDPDRQTDLNRRARGLLGSVPDGARDNDWRVVNAKVSVGLFESGAIAFDEGEYRDIVSFMCAQRTKDAAGRVEFLANWLVEHGRTKEAIKLLRSTEKRDNHSAPVQRERVTELLKRLVTLPTVVSSGMAAGHRQGTSRAVRPRRRGKSTAVKKDDPEPPHQIHFRVGCNTVSGMFFVPHLKEGIRRSPHLRHLQKRISLSGAFLFVFFI